MHQQFSPTGRLPSSEPALQLLPLRLTDAERLDKARLRTIMFNLRYGSAPAFFRGMDRMARHDGLEGLRKQAPMSSYVDAIDEIALWSSRMNSQAEPFSFDVRAIRGAWPNPDAPQPRKSLLSLSIERVYGVTDSPRHLAQLH